MHVLDLASMLKMVSPLSLSFVVIAKNFTWLMVLTEVAPPFLMLVHRLHDWLHCLDALAEVSLP